ncbi:MAG TPA: threonylcarbamoyl-AMP synthase [Candidatus Omnitrophica bacterium]|nr:threonylcarbamoyl-AMP synthase [Candidatus Omnitrophota bacterium]
MKKIFIDPKNLDYSLLKEVATVIQQGGIVALPTETVYGLAACADREEAVEKLYMIKKRPKEKPFTYVVDEPKKAMNEYFSVMSPFGYRLVEKYWPGPLTIVYYSQQEDKIIGLRVPSHIITQCILKEAKCRIFLPSANISGEKEALSSKEVEEIFNGEIDLIVEGINPLYQRPSTVLDLTYHPFKILREGVISEREIINVFVKKRITFVCTGNTCRSPMAEFLLKKYLRGKKPYLENRYEIISRGIIYFEGQPLSLSVAKILREKEKIEVNNFFSKKIEREIILSSDFIFTMEDSQREYILKLEPIAEGRVFCLKKFLPSDLEKDVPDPIGKDYKIYEEVYFLIKKAILELIEWL